jgi:hypothetical protein
MAGNAVNKGILDQKAANAIINLRNSLDEVDTVFEFLRTIPNTPLVEGVTEHTELTEPLMAEPFGYTADEAYLIRYLFENLHGLPVQGLMEAGRKLTGLE